MDAIFDFLLQVGNFVISVYNFLVDTVEGLAYIVQLTGQFMVQIPIYFSWLPAEWLAIVVAIFGIAIVYKIVGREG